MHPEFQAKQCMKCFEAIDMLESQAWQQQMQSTPPVGWSGAHEVAIDHVFESPAKRARGDHTCRCRDDSQQSCSDDWLEFQHQWIHGSHADPCKPCVGADPDAATHAVMPMDMSMFGCIGDRDSTACLDHAFACNVANKLIMHRKGFSATVGLLPQYGFLCHSKPLATVRVPLQQ